MGFRWFQDVQMSQLCSKTSKLFVLISEEEEDLLLHCKKTEQVSSPSQIPGTVCVMLRLVLKYCKSNLTC